jgi:exodeoxyribonuclease-3
MQVATWNVNSIRTRQTHVKDWLQENPVDLLCLQETKVIDRDFPTTPFTELGYHLYFSGQKAYNGVAIFSRQPLTDITTGFSPILGEEIVGNFDDQKRVITGVINGIRVVNLYIPNGASISGEKYEYKLAWLKLLDLYLQRLQQQSLELCVCGDFNVAIENKDIYNPKGKEKQIMASPEERKAINKVLEIGLKDAFRKFTSETGHFTWWDYRRGGFQNNRGWRIDYIYLTPNLYNKAISCKIDVEPRKLTQPSDHTPVIVEF